MPSPAFRTAAATIDEDSDGSRLWGGELEDLGTEAIEQRFIESPFDPDGAVRVRREVGVRNVRAVPHFGLDSYGTGRFESWRSASFSAFSTMACAITRDVSRAALAQHAEPLRGFLLSW